MLCLINHIIDTSSHKIKTHFLKIFSAEEATWVRPHVGPAPAGGAMEVWCSGDRVTVEGGGLGDPIPRYRN